jgi:rhodanese-related sulfurtransferase
MRRIFHCAHRAMPLPYGCCAAIRTGRARERTGKGVQMALKKGFKQMLAEANAAIETISVHDAFELVGDADSVFVDIRHSDERSANGAVDGAVHAPRGFLEFMADPESPMHKPSGKRLVLYCASGGRSALAAKTLVVMGVANVCHIAGGFAAWKEAGGPVE